MFSRTACKCVCVRSDVTLSRGSATVPRGVFHNQGGRWTHLLRRQAWSQQDPKRTASATDPKATGLNYNRTAATADSAQRDRTTGEKKQKNNKKTGIVKRGRRKNDNPFCRQAHVQKWADKRTNYTKVDHGMSYISEKL